MNLYEENEKLVYYVYIKYFKSKTPADIEEDLLQEGKIGLYKACKCFNENYKNKFSTFACRCIYTQICMFLRRIKKHYVCFTFSDLSDDDFNFELSLNDNFNVDEILDDIVLKNNTKQILLTFKKDYQKKAILLWISGYKQTEITKECNVSKSSVCRTIGDFIYRMKKAYQVER